MKLQFRNMHHQKSYVKHITFLNRKLHDLKQTASCMKHRGGSVWPSQSPDLVPTERFSVNKDVQTHKHQLRSGKTSSSSVAIDSRRQTSHSQKMSFQGFYLFIYFSKRFYLL